MPLILKPKSRLTTALIYQAFLILILLVSNCAGLDFLARGIWDPGDLPCPFLAMIEAIHGYHQSRKHQESFDESLEFQKYSSLLP